MQHFIGCDAHKKFSVFVMVDEHGHASQPMRVEHQREAYWVFLQKLPAHSEIALEACGFWYWMVDEMEAAGHLPRLANPTESQKTMGKPHKHDPLDAKGFQRVSDAWESQMIVAAKKCGLWICLWTCLASAAVAAPPATLRGAVVDSEGAAVGMAHIIVHEDGSGRQTRQATADVRLRSDERGRLSVRLEPGFYDVCIMAQAFTPDCRKVLLKHEQTTAVNVRLRIDPQVIKQLGDSFGRSN